MKFLLTDLDKVALKVYYYTITTEVLLREQSRSYE